MDRLQKQIEFIVEVDKLKTILRQSRITDRSRRENDAEHTWHIALMAVILEQYANEPKIDLLKVIHMLLIHDIVEIDAGDTFAYDEKGHEDKREREEKAAERIFRLLPEDQYTFVYELWSEFEDRVTPEAKFANALDRLQPLLLNYHTGGSTWKEHDIRQEQVLQKNAHIEEGSSMLWEYAKQIIDASVKNGYLKQLE